MADAIVPFVPPLLSAAEVRTGRAVRGKTSAAIAQVMNRALGCGATLVPMHSPNATIAAATAKTYRYRVWPRLHAFRRAYIIHLVRGAEHVAPVDVTINGGSARALTVAGTIPGVAQPMMLIEELAAPSSSETTLTIEIDNSAGGASLTVKGIGVFELPRAELGVGTARSEYGVQLGSCQPKSPIFDRTGVNIEGIANAVKQGETLCRRAGLLAWAQDEADAYATSSGVFVNMFELDPILLGRKKHRSATVLEVVADVYARTDTAGTTGEVRLTMVSGDTVTITIPDSQTFDWRGGNGGAFDVDAEDLSSADGRRSTRWDTVAIEVRRTAGAGEVEVAGVCVGESS